MPPRAQCHAPVEEASWSREERGRKSCEWRYAWEVSGRERKMLERCWGMRNLPAPDTSGACSPAQHALCGPLLHWMMHMSLLSMPGAGRCRGRVRAILPNGAPRDFPAEGGEPFPVIDESLASAPPARRAWRCTTPPLPPPCVMHIHAMNTRCREASWSREEGGRKTCEWK